MDSAGFDLLKFNKIQQIRSGLNLQFGLIFTECAEKSAKSSPKFWIQLGLDFLALDPNHPLNLQKISSQSIFIAILKSLH
jgi:hypothetical protein